MMSDDTRGLAQIKDTDIVFDCPYCDKSLAIDYRGAGLTIPCSDCGKMVQVPIPDGMDLSDIDTASNHSDVADDQRDGHIESLQSSLAAAQFRIEQLEVEMERLKSGRDTLEKVRRGNIYRLGAILEKVGAMQEAVGKMSAALEGISELAQEEVGVVSRSTNKADMPRP